MAVTPPCTTLLLDTVTWDLVLDAAGNIAVAGPPYSVAQDAASEIKTFAGEVYYDTARGLPYFAQIFGKTPPIELLRSRFNLAAKSVPGVVTAQTFFTSLTDRTVSGQVQVTDTTGATAAVSF